MCAHICARARVLQKKAAGPLKAKMESYRAAVWASSVSFPALLSLFLSLSLSFSPSLALPLSSDRDHLKVNPNRPRADTRTRARTFTRTHTHCSVSLSLSLSPCMLVLSCKCNEVTAGQLQCKIKPAISSCARARTQTHARTRTLWHPYVAHVDLSVAAAHALPHALSLWVYLSRSLSLALSPALSLSVNRTYFLVSGLRVHLGCRSSRRRRWRRRRRWKGGAAVAGAEGLLFWGRSCVSGPEVLEEDRAGWRRRRVGEPSFPPWQSVLRWSHASKEEKTPPFCSFCVNTTTSPVSLCLSLCVPLCVSVSVCCCRVLKGWALSLCLFLLRLSLACDPTLRPHPSSLCQSGAAQPCRNAQRGEQGRRRRRRRAAAAAQEVQCGGEGCSCCSNHAENARLI